MPVLLDLFCGAGGAAVGYARAGFEVVGVDINPQPNYPFKFYQADAFWFLERTVAADEFDVIHASPPCQGYSSKTRDQAKHPRLIEPLRRELQGRLRHVPYVIENVEGARSDLVNPIRLCGSSFALGVRRHRLFESNLPLTAPPCAHASQLKQYDIYDHGRWYKSRVVHVYGNGGGKGKDHWQKAMGIDWMTNEELVESIPPAFTEHLGVQLFEALS